jgi:uncharacterized protein (TIGR03437 family)
MKRFAACLGLLLLALTQRMAAQSTSPLQITTAALPNGNVGQSYNVQINATGGTPPYSYTATNNIPPGLTFSTSGLLSGTPTTTGNYRLVVTVHDSAQTAATQIYQVVIGPAQKQALTVSPNTLPTATVGLSYSATVTATGGSGPYSFVSRGNIGLTILSDGQVTGTVPQGTVPQTYPLDVTVTDSTGRQTSTAVSIPVVAALHFLTGSPLTTAMEGVGYSTTFQAAGGTGDYTFNATGVPASLTLSPQGVLSGTPPAGSSGNVPIQVTVTSGAVSATSNFILQVLSPQILIQNTALPTARETVPYSASLQAGGGTGPYTFTVTGAPSWVTVTFAGVISGTPPVGSAGATNVIVSATDARNSTTVKQFTLLVLSVHGNITITTGTPLSDATVGTQISVPLTATGGSAPYRWSGTGLPPGLNITADTGLLVGIPTAHGDYFITVQATDQNNAVAFQSLEMKVTGGPVMILTNSPLATAQLTTAYSVQFDATGTDPKTWSVVSGGIPAGLTFSSTGILSGVPTSTGSFSFTVRVADANGLNSTKFFQISSNQAGGFLVLSEGSLAIQAVANGNVPTPQVIAAISTAGTQLSFQVSAQASWLSFTPAAGTTPSNITVSVNQAGLAPGVYTDNLVVTSPGQVQNIPVTLTVTSATGGLLAESSAVNLIGDTTKPLSQTLLIRNTGGAPIDFKVSADQPFLILTPSISTVAPNSTALVTLTIAAGTLTGGSYNATIHIDSNISSVQVPVSILVSGQPQIYLETQGVLLEARAGNGVSGPKVRSFKVLTSSQDTLSFNVKQIGGDGFLQLVSTTGSTSASQPGAFSFTTNASALSPGAYYAQIEITSDAAVNSPQEFVVVLNVTPADSSLPSPNPFPAGLVFAPQNNFASTQTVQVYTSSDQPLAFQVAMSTFDGGTWLTTDVTGGEVSTNAAGVLKVTADPTTLAPGVYRGEVHISINNLAVRSVNVTLIVPKTGSSGSAGIRTQAAACKPGVLVVTETGLPGNFATPASWPRSVSVRLNDDCGNVVPNGQVVAEFSNGDAPQFLRLTDATNAVYANDWVPVHPLSQITITTRAVVTGLASGTAQVTGAVTPNAAPTLAQNGTLHNLNPILGAPLAPGTIVQIYGTNLAAAATSATALPLPTSLSNTSVLVQGKSIPLYYVSPGQINAELPTDLVPGRQYQLLVRANGAITEPQPFNTQTVAPGVARFTDGKVIAQHGDFSLVTPSNPAKPGEYLVIYLAGLGITNQKVTDGSASPGTPLAYVTALPVVTVAGKPASVFFAGLTPGLAGLYQINFQVPADAASGELRLDINQATVFAQTSVLVVVAP